MCIAIYKKPEGVVTDAELKRCFESNGDGCGFGYIHTDEEGEKSMRVGKYMKYDEFLEMYHEALALCPESPFFIHFRIKTHGTINTFNCHPFFVDDDTIMMHNGIISQVGLDPKRSDTQMFNDNYLKLLPEGWMFNPGISKLIEDKIGTSKVLAMDIEGNVSLYNEEKGHWKEDVWFSNMSYKPKVVSHTTTYGNSGYRHTTQAGRNGWGGKTTYSSSTTGVLTYTALSSVKCDVCGGYRQVNYMYPYLLGDDFTIYCLLCHNKVVESDNVSAHEKITTDIYVDFLNMSTWEKSQSGKEHNMLTADDYTSWDTADDVLGNQEIMDEQDEMYDALADAAKMMAQ